MTPRDQCEKKKPHHQVNYLRRAMSRCSGLCARSVPLIYSPLAIASYLLVGRRRRREIDRRNGPGIMQSPF